MSGTIDIGSTTMQLLAGADGCGVYACSVDGADKAVRVCLGAMSAEAARRLLSDYVGCRLAALVGAAVPVCSLVTVRDGARRSVGVATEWAEADIRVNLRDCATTSPPMARSTKVLTALAAIRVADTWTMNWDRWNGKNVLVRLACDAGFSFIDFDQAFLSKASWAEGKPRLHWLDGGFDDAWLSDRELLSGVAGIEGRQQAPHYADARRLLEGMSESALQVVLATVPEEWLGAAWPSARPDDLRERWEDMLGSRRRVVLDVTPHDI